MMRPMKVTGVMLALIDVPTELAQEYNRWYDLDHLPEHLSKADILTAGRYVASTELTKAPGVLAAELTGGHPLFATLYFFGGPLDFMGEEAAAGWRGTDRRIIKAGRYWQVGRSVHSSRWSWPTPWRVPRSTLRLTPFLTWRTAESFWQWVVSFAERVPRSGGVGESVHLPDLLAVPGILAGLRFETVDASNRDLIVFTFFTATTRRP